jgi:cytochrome P450
MQATASVMPAIFRLHGYFHRIFDQRRLKPGHDLISHLLRSSEEGHMTADELFWFTFLLLIAGNETTTNLLGTLLLTVALQPAAFERLRREPQLIPAAVEESLRLHSPVQAFYRTALRPYRVEEATVPAGGRVLLIFAAANRDPRKYPDPERYVLERNPSDHLAFGSGIHFCLGAHLARLEAAAVLSRLTDRVESLELAGQPVWTRNPALRGLERLPLQFRAA